MNEKSNQGPLACFPPGKASRREFFRRGGAVLGAGVASAAVGTSVAGASAAAAASGASSTLGTSPSGGTLGAIAATPLEATGPDRVAIRELHRSFMALIEAQHYDAVMNLFDDQAHLTLSDSRASGRAGIEQLFTETYRRQNGAVFHRAYRYRAGLRNDSDETIRINENGRRATATFHTDVEVCTPLSPTCTAAQMARLHGHVADQHWVPGRFDIEYVKVDRAWKIASLCCQTSVAEQFGRVPQR